ncbi:hypothetical protein H0H93_010361 [Arthromyces matolae]|nr:hypothetical protein H0H93_010361 [Arthromyces matolae]
MSSTPIKLLHFAPPSLSTFPTSKLQSPDMAFTMRAGVIAAFALSLYLANATPLPMTDSAVVAQARDVLPSFSDVTSSSLVSRDLELFNPVTVNVRDVPPAGHSSDSSIVKRSTDQETGLSRREHTYSLAITVNNMYLSIETNPVAFERELAEDIIRSLRRADMK